MLVIAAIAAALLLAWHTAADSGVPVAAATPDDTAFRNTRGTTGLLPWLTT
jgi:hypothetical protein